MVEPDRVRRRALSQDVVVGRGGSPRSCRDRGGYSEVGRYVDEHRGRFGVEPICTTLWRVRWMMLTHRAGAAERKRPRSRAAVFLVPVAPRAAARPPVGDQLGQVVELLNMTWNAVVPWSACVRSAWAFGSLKATLAARTFTTPE